MHNLLSRNQLAEWVHIDVNLNRCNEAELDLVNDYFDCLIECDEDQATCKRICRILLNTKPNTTSRVDHPSFFVL